MFDSSKVCIKGWNDEYWVCASCKESVALSLCLLSGVARFLEAGIRWGSEGSWFVFHFIQPLIVCYGTLTYIYKEMRMQSIVGIDSKHAWYDQ